MSSQQPSGASLPRLGPTWRGNQGGRGFQPPPPAENRRSRSESYSSAGSGDSSTNKPKNVNKFALLDEDEDIMINGDTEDSKRFTPVVVRSSTKAGRSLADLAARAPDVPPTKGVKPAIARTESYTKDEAKVIRVTREKLLALRPRPLPNAEPPACLKHLEGSAIISKEPLDPVCWDSFDADEIWAQVPRDRPRAPGLAAPKGTPGALAEQVPVAPPNRRSLSVTSIGGVGKWARGVALPPPEEGANRRRQDAENPNELWDDPLDSNKPAADFSSFGNMPDDLKDDATDAFNFDRMAEATLEFEEELRGGNNGEAGEQNEELEVNAAPVDASRPLATTGTTIRSGSGDNVNVFEDFDEPCSELQPEAPAVKAADENPDASSRLMQMIGVTPSAEPELAPPVDGRNLNPWASLSGQQDPIVPAVEGIAGLSRNPWGGAAAAPQAGSGFDLVARLEAVAQEQQAQESMQMRQAREQEILRRRQVEEEAQRRAMAQKQAEEQARQQQMQGPSQVELILMERISQILENSWGRSDLISVLSTLHTEDSRVIPLLGNVDALRSLVARHPRRVALRHDPAFGSEMAILLMTNVQFQQYQQQQQDAENRSRREEIQRLEQQRRMQTMQKKQSTPSIDPNAPWYYSDPQGNVQGPFRGDEMRQWLEAGYFKGDLPISQQTTGQFIPLASIFPDLSIAFRTPSDEATENAAKVEAERRAQEEAQRRMVEAKAAAAAAERERREQQAAVSAKAAATQSNSNGSDQNDSSAQLKMILGLVGQAADNGTDEAYSSQHDPFSQQRPSLSVKPSNSKQPRVFTNAPAPSMPAAKPPATTVAPAWGGVSMGTPRKSMPEIQQEEARTTAFLAMERQTTGRSHNSGWANVAATSGQGWQSGALKQQTARAVVTGPNTFSLPTTNSSRSIPVRASSVPATGAPAPRGGAQQQPADAFGATMNPALEAWCKEQMRKLNGSDDLTLVSFCMTLNDPAEIRQYLTAYLGSTPQINNFATEFINRKGGGKARTEEWETTVKPKKTKKVMKK